MNNLQNSSHCLSLHLEVPGCSFSALRIGWKIVINDANLLLFMQIRSYAKYSFLYTVPSSPPLALPILAILKKKIQELLLLLILKKIKNIVISDRTYW